MAELYIRAVIELTESFISSDVIAFFPNETLCTQPAAIPFALRTLDSEVTCIWHMQDLRNGAAVSVFMPVSDSHHPKCCSGSGGVTDSPTPFIQQPILCQSQGNKTAREFTD